MMLNSVYNPVFKGLGNGVGTFIPEDREDDTELPSLFQLDQCRQPLDSLNKEKGKAARFSWMLAGCAMISVPMANGLNNHWEYIIDGTRDTSAIEIQFNMGRNQFSSTAEISVTDSVVNLMCKLCADGEVTGAVRSAFSRTEKSFAIRDLDAINELLVASSRRAADLHVRVLTGLLRSTFRAKTRLYGWRALLLAARAELDARGIDSQRALSGLS